MCVNSGHNYLIAEYWSLAWVRWRCSQFNCGHLWPIFVCLYSHVVIFGYAVLVGIDLLVMLANGIYLAILKSHYSDFCFDHDMDFSKSPIWGCADWRHGHYERATGVMVCLFLAVLLRALNFASACLLGKNVYDDQYDDGVGDIRKTHDLAERGRQF